jgi:hypothetical protein
METGKTFARELAPHAAWRGIELLWDFAKAAMISAIVLARQWFVHHWDIVTIALVFLGSLGILLWRERIVYHANKKAAQAAVSICSKEVFDEFRRQLAVLSYFEIFAIWRVIVTEGITGDQLAGLVQSLGFPVVTLEQENRLRETLPHINAKVTFLEYSVDSKKWTVRKTAIDPVSWILKNLQSPFWPQKT